MALFPESNLDFQNTEEDSEDAKGTKGWPMTHVQWLCDPQWVSVHSLGNSVIGNYWNVKSYLVWTWLITT